MPRVQEIAAADLDGAVVCRVVAAVERDGDEPRLRFADGDALRLRELHAWSQWDTFFGSGELDPSADGDARWLPEAGLTRRFAGRVVAGAEVPRAGLALFRFDGTDERLAFVAYGEGDERWGFEAETPHENDRRWIGFAETTAGLAGRVQPRAAR